MLFSNKMSRKFNLPYPCWNPHPTSTENKKGTKKFGLKRTWTIIGDFGKRNSTIKLPTPETSGKTGIEPITDGFENHCSTNWAIHPWRRGQDLNLRYNVR